MDPYLETPQLWPDVHHELISQIRSALNPAIRPKYVARVELRVYISNEDDPGREAIIPDVRIEKAKSKGGKRSRNQPAPDIAVAEPLDITILLDNEIEEGRVEIRYRQTGKLVTVIEVVSPTNKIRGAVGRQSFLGKRQETWAAKINWVEIDLLRGGLPTVPHARLSPSDYRILVWRAGQRGAQYWPVQLRQPLPIIGIPLREPDPDVPLDLGAVLQSAYERGAYELSLDYRRKPDPPLKAHDAAWADRLLKDRGLR
jgi:hypothetical protein